MTREKNLANITCTRGGLIDVGFFLGGIFKILGSVLIPAIRAKFIRELVRAKNVALFAAGARVATSTPRGSMARLAKAVEAVLSTSKRCRGLIGPVRP